MLADEKALANKTCTNGQSLFTGASFQTSAWCVSAEKTRAAREESIPNKKTSGSNYFYNILENLPHTFRYTIAKCVWETVYTALLCRALFIVFTAASHYWHQNKLLSDFVCECRTAIKAHVCPQHKNNTRLLGSWTFISSARLRYQV